MRIPVTFSLDASLANDLRALAVRLGVDYSALAERLLQPVRASNAFPALEAWAQDLKRREVERGASQSAPLKPSERFALSHVGEDWTRLQAIQARTGQSVGITYRALEQLAGRGLVERDRPHTDNRAIWPHTTWRRKASP